MQALILVGGRGTRLRPLTKETPKPVVELVDRPFLGYMIDWLAGHGVEEVILACGYLPDAIREVLGDGEPGGPRLTYVVEPEPLGTAGAIRFAADRIKGRFLALNGDSLTDLNLTELVGFHETSAARATLGLYRVDDPSAFGLVLHDEHGQVTEFLEKPEPGSAAAARAAAIEVAEINAGMYVLEPEVLDMIPAGRRVSIEREIFPRLAGEGLFARALDGYWEDIGTPQRYLRATWDILEGRVRTAVEPRADGVFVAPGAEVNGAVGPRAVVGPDCRVASGATLRDSVMLGGSEIGPGCTVTDSILAPGAKLGPGVELTGAVIGPHETVEAGGDRLNA